MTIEVHPYIMYRYIHVLKYQSWKLFFVYPTHSLTIWIRLLVRERERERERERAD